MRTYVLPPITDEDGAITPFDDVDCWDNCHERHAFHQAELLACTEWCDRSFPAESGEGNER